MIFQVNDFVCVKCGLCKQGKPCPRKITCGRVTEVIDSGKEKQYKVIFGETRVETLREQDMRILSYAIN